MEDIASDLLDTPTPVCLPHHYTPLPLLHFFHEWERLPGGIALDSPHNSVRLHTSVWPKPPSIRWGSPDSSKQPLVSSPSKASVLHQGFSSLLLKGAIEDVPQSDLKQGFFSRYFLVPKKDGGLRPILDLRRLNLSFYKRKFKMLTLKTVLSQITLISSLPAEVQETIVSARAPATRKLYSSKWRVFESWCAVDPVNCPVGPVLEFLQEKLAAGAATTTLRVYVTAIAARRELYEIPLWRHWMVSVFMRGIRRLRPVRSIEVPSWDWSVVLEGLMVAPFEPLESAPERILTLKATLLLALTSLKRSGDLQALSVSEMCMDFAPGLVKMTLWPRFYPHRFALKWSRFTSFILLLLLQVRMRVFTCSVLSELWR